jgi:DHA2 family methylenomycin A resistance protein-like MFS transporter
MTAGFTLGGMDMLLVWTDVNTSYIITLIGLLLIGFGRILYDSLVNGSRNLIRSEGTGRHFSGALNSSHQLGATLAVAILGSILSGSQSFIGGMHMSFILITVILICGSLLPFAFVDRK